MNDFEQQILNIKDSLDRIAQAKGKNKESEIRRVYNQNDEAIKALKLLLDPSVVFHIGKRPFAFLLPFELVREPQFKDLFSLCEWLQSKKALTDNDIARVQYSLVGGIRKPDLRQFAKEFICKTITLGVTAKTVNKALGFEFISEFSCMFPSKYFYHQGEVEGKHFYLTEMLNGVRCLAFCKENSIKLFTKQGQPIEELPLIELRLAYLRQGIGKDFVFDGELLITNRNRISSKEQHKQTAIAIRKKGIKTGITYNVFDVLDAEAFETKCCETPYYLRRQKLDTYCSLLTADDVPIKSLPILYHGKDTSKIIEHLNIQRDLGHEGVMINLADATYQFAKTNALLEAKVKEVN